MEHSMIDGEIRLEESRAIGVKYVSGSEPFVLGHYPGNPLFPGVLSVELILEVASFLVGRRLGAAYQAGGLKKVQFLDLARPGDVLQVEAQVKELTADGCVVSGIVSADGRVKARATVAFRGGPDASAEPVPAAEVHS
jgi:3-hydroxymyristoyl/3-hydroxydecanoyl-(acyl carrier protein) dehydratase